MYKKKCISNINSDSNKGLEGASYSHVFAQWGSLFCVRINKINRNRNMINIAPKLSTSTTSSIEVG